MTHPTLHARVVSDLRFGRFVLQAHERRLLVDGEPAALGARAIDLLFALAGEPGRMVDKRELMERVWPDRVVEENNLAAQVSALRKVLGADLIATVPGRGYRLVLPPDGDDPARAAALPPMPADGATPIALAPARAGNATGSLPGNVPQTLPPLIGRDDELQRLAALGREERLVSVVGAGGIGKTRLALAAAQALRERFDDGVWLVELAPVADPALVPAAVAQAMGLSVPCRRPLADELADALRDHCALVVLDNGEHVIEAVSELADTLLRGTRRLHLLATSQELLKVQSEHLFRLAPLALPEAGDDAQAARSRGAVALFVDRAAALQPAFALHDESLAGETLDAVIDICRRLDGLPLAIELAAARVPLLGVAGVRDRLHERFRMLTGGSRVGLRRHQTLRETLDWSHGLLTADEQRAFRRLGVFAGSFGLAAAQGVLAEPGIDEWATLDLLGALVDKSLLVAQPGEPPRYRLLETPRAYALEKLRDAGETDAMLERHARAMVASFETLDAAVWTQPSQKRLAAALPDLDNLRAAIDWAARSPHQADLHIALAAGGEWLWHHAGLRLEGLSALRLAMTRLSASTPPVLEAWLQRGFAAISYPVVGAEQRAACDRAVALGRELGDRVGLFRSLHMLARLTSVSGDLATCEAAAAELQALHDPAWPPISRWAVIASRAYVGYYGGRPRDACGATGELLQLAEAAGDDHLRSVALSYLEQIAQAQGRYDEAVQRGRALIEQSRCNAFHGSCATEHVNLCLALTHVGDIDEALAAGREAARAGALDGTLWSALDVYAFLACRRRRWREAALALGRADAAFARSGHPREPNERRARDLTQAELATQVDAARLAAWLAEGAGLEDDEAARIALAD